MTMNMEKHVYQKLLTARDPQSPQPTKISTPLKPHQLAGLAKAIQLESKGYIVCDYVLSEDEDFQKQSRYDDYRRVTGLIPNTVDAASLVPLPPDEPMLMKIHTNMGILGDIVGYGKTLLALAIVAAHPTSAIQSEHIHTSSIYTNSAYTTVEKPWLAGQLTWLSTTTLIVVPKGPVFVQWDMAIKQQSKLKHLAIGGSVVIEKMLPPVSASVQEIKTFLAQWDAVLVKDTMIKRVIERYAHLGQCNPFLRWDRVMIDEAHTTLWTVPIMTFRFMWMISSTYSLIRYRSSTCRQLAQCTRGISAMAEQNMVIRGETDFVKESFNVPPSVELFHACKLEHHINHLMPFLSREVQTMINAADYTAAVKALGGDVQTESSLVQLLTADIERDISNREKEVAMVTALDIAEESRVARLKTLTTNIERLKTRQVALQERISEISTKTCPICYDPYTDPIMLACTHVFCGKCIMDWLKNRATCPHCRVSVDQMGMVSIASASQLRRRIDATKNPLLPKDDVLVNLIRARPLGRFLIFATHDGGFVSIEKRLAQEGISTVEMKGSTACMMHNLVRFKAGEIRVVMLNTHYAGSGIDISCATDVVIFHSMAEAKIQAVGRAQRVGRTTQLTIHNLCYPREMPGVVEEVVA